jgi:epoxyqueuosine reductase QueG
VLAEHADAAGVGPAQADDAAQKHRLAGARAADHAENLAAAHVEVEILMHHLGTEAVDQTAHLDHRRLVAARCGLGVRGAHQSISM